MTRPSRALIDLDALRHNYQVAKQLHGGRALAVLKANAYGHGAVRCAQALVDVADGFATAFLEEAVALRLAGIQSPILVLEGMFDSSELTRAGDLNLWIVIHHEEQLRILEKDSSTQPLQVWLKCDSGMHRAGFAPADMADAYARLQASGKASDIVLMTHFARADEPDSQSTAQQVAAFDAATISLPGLRSLSNSAGVLAWPQARRDWARPGILLYGAEPMPAPDAGLIPVMTLESTVFAVRTLQSGDVLGYGGKFMAHQPTRIGLVAMGYADGYPRLAGTGTPVAVNGQITRLVGRVSMDMLTVDLTDMPDAGIGSKVELWGKQISVNTVAKQAGTIAYELLCNVKRISLTYAVPGEHGSPRLVVPG